MKRFTRALAAIMLMAAVVFVAGCNKPEDELTNSGGNGGGNDTHAYVDLGLPSGTLWATCNVGASKPEEYGDYFAWGETEPKTNYNWDNYKYSVGFGNGGAFCNTLTKYCTNSEYGYNGFADNLTVLLPEDDAATANWGSVWCMPTAEQWGELRDNTNNVWTTKNGVNGRLFTASNGNCLFLPAPDGKTGGYWSASLSDGIPDHSKIFFFDSSEYDVGGDPRDAGLSVRGVRSVK